MTFELTVLIAYATLTFGIGLCLGWVLGVLHNPPAPRDNAQEWVDACSDYTQTYDPYGVQDFDRPAEPEPTSGYPRLTVVRGHDYN